MMNELTGVTLIRATENDVSITIRVKISLAYFFSLKNMLNSSIRPVITHSSPPIYRKETESIL